MNKTSSTLRTIAFVWISIFSICGIVSCHSGKAETPAVEKKTMSRAEMDSIAKVQKDSLRMVKLKATAYFPLLKAGPGTGVLPVEGVDEIPDPNRDYNLLFEFSQGDDDSTQTKKSKGLKEVARVLNLHIASGIPLSHVHAVVLTHGAALFSIMNNEAFRARYKADNPNDSLITEMMNDGVKFIGCGQAMRFEEVEKKQLHAGVKVALTAQVMKSNYLGQGYVLYDISDDK